MLFDELCCLNCKVRVILQFEHFSQEKCIYLLEKAEWWRHADSLRTRLVRYKAPRLPLVSQSLVSQSTKINSKMNSSTTILPGSKRHYPSALFSNPSRCLYNVSGTLTTEMFEMDNKRPAKFAKPAIPNDNQLLPDDSLQLPAEVAMVPMMPKRFGYHGFSGTSITPVIPEHKMIRPTAAHQATKIYSKDGNSSSKLEMEKDVFIEPLPGTKKTLKDFKPKIYSKDGNSSSKLEMEKEVFVEPLPGTKKTLEDFKPKIYSKNGNSSSKLEMEKDVFIGPLPGTKKTLEDLKPKPFQARPIPRSHYKEPFQPNLPIKKGPHPINNTGEEEGISQKPDVEVMQQKSDQTPFIGVPEKEGWKSTHCCIHALCATCPKHS